MPDKRTPPTLRVVDEDDVGCHHQPQAEDARHRDGVLPRELVRQPAASVARPREKIDRLREGTAQCAGRQHLVAQAYEKYAVSEVR